jgi:hypothetical protein
MRGLYGKGIEARQKRSGKGNAFQEQGNAESRWRGSAASPETENEKSGPSQDEPLTILEYLNLRLDQF